MTLPMRVARATMKNPACAFPVRDGNLLLHKSHVLHPRVDDSFTKPARSAVADVRKASFWGATASPHDSETVAAAFGGRNFPNVNSAVWRSPATIYRRGAELRRRRAGIAAPSLLIVGRLFFIQRRTGEVAEWSKALPC